MQVTTFDSCEHPTCLGDNMSSTQALANRLANAATRSEYNEIAAEIDRPRKVMSLHDAALLYTSWGWPVFPLATTSKAPAIPKSKGGQGFKDATTNRDRIDRWWTRHPTHNIGIATGHTFDVIDIDPRNDGVPTLVNLLERGKLPVIHGISCTASNGMHLFVKRTGRGCLPHVKPGVDYKALGGYIVAPPSILADDRRYAWSIKPSPEIKK